MIGTDMASGTGHEEISWEIKGTGMRTYEQLSGAEGKKYITGQNAFRQVHCLGNSNPVSK